MVARQQQTRLYHASAVRRFSAQVVEVQVVGMHQQARQSLSPQQGARFVLSFQAVAVRQALQAHHPQQAAQVRQVIVNSAGKVAAVAVLLLRSASMPVTVEQVAHVAVVAAAAVRLWQAVRSLATVALAVPVVLWSLAGKEYKMGKAKIKKIKFSDKVLERADLFFRGFTAFHLVGFLLLFFGGRIGDKGGFSGAGFTFSVTLAEVAGFVTFFRELAKSWFDRRKAAKTDGP